MTTVTLMPSGKTTEAAEGTTLLDAILTVEADFPHNCTKGTCGACHIFVTEGRKGVSKISREENEKLDQLVGVGSKSRLACLATLLGTEPVTVEILSFR